MNPEQTHLLLDDELDEQKTASLDGHTRTMIWDVSKLDTPVLTGNFYSSEKSIGASGPCVLVCVAWNVLRPELSKEILTKLHDK